MAKSCVFFGHRWVVLTEQEKILLHATIIKLITEEGVEDFIFGGYGDFDSMAYRMVSDIKNDYPQIRKIYAQAYIPKHQEDMDHLKRVYDFVYLPEGTEVGLQRYAISRRNRSLAKECDFMVCYIISNSGGAYAAMKTAKTHGKTVINIAENSSHLVEMEN